MRIKTDHNFVSAGDKRGTEYLSWHSRTMTVLPLFQVYMCTIIEYCIRLTKLRLKATKQLTDGKNVEKTQYREKSLSGTVSYVHRAIVNKQMVAKIDSALMEQFLMRLPGNEIDLTKSQVEKIRDDLKALRVTCTKNLLTTTYDVTH